MPGLFGDFSIPYWNSNGFPLITGVGSNDFHEDVQENGLFPALGNAFLHSGIPDYTLDGVDYLFGTDLSDQYDISKLDVSDLADLGLDELFEPNNSADPGTSPFPRLQQQTLDYLNADLAKFYGMDRNTAYQEALANSAYQRAVADMQKAGLNPAAIFGAGRGSGAQGVAYISPESSYSGISSAKDAKLFSSEDFGLIASLSGLATALVTKKPSNFWLGQQGAQAVMTVLNGLDQKLKG